MMEYRKANITDLDELIRIRLEFIRGVQGLAPDCDMADLKDSLYSYFKETLDSNSFVAWLALHEGRIVATSGLSFYSRPPSYTNVSGKVAYIMNMYTVSEYRNRGLAKNLFQRILDEAINRGYRKISLHATESGRPIYEKFGFKNIHDEMVLSF